MEKKRAVCMWGCRYGKIESGGGSEREGRASEREKSGVEGSSDTFGFLLMSFRHADAIRRDG